MLTKNEYDKIKNALMEMSYKVTKYNGDVKNRVDTEAVLELLNDYTLPPAPRTIIRVCDGNPWPGGGNDIA